MPTGAAGQKKGLGGTPVGAYMPNRTGVCNRKLVGSGRRNRMLAFDTRSLRQRAQVLRQGRTKMSLGNGASANGAPNPALVVKGSTATFQRDVIDASRSPAGAGRFLGALVRTVPDARPGHRAGGARSQGQGQAGQDQCRREPGPGRPVRRAVDPHGLRLRRRTAGRRVHGRAAGKRNPPLRRPPDPDGRAPAPATPTPWGRSLPPPPKRPRPAITAPPSRFTAPFSTSSPTIPMR